MRWFSNVIVSIGVGILVAIGSFGVAAALFSYQLYLNITEGKEK